MTLYMHFLSPALTSFDLDFLSGRRGKLDRTDYRYGLECCLLAERRA